MFEFKLGFGERESTEDLTISISSGESDPADVELPRLPG
jgi:hypothetical protein